MTFQFSYSAERISIGLLAALAIICFPTFAQAQSSAEARLKERNIVLPAPPKPVGNYVEWVRVGNLLYLSGHGGGAQARGKGKVGRDLSVEQGYQEAREVGLNLLATTRDALGSLDKVKRVVKVFGMVNSAPGFDEQPKVINGFSDLMVEVFGDTGKHARTAVGMAELPFGIPVEIEMIIEVSD
jgi:enamine deaminase RidA (YjgF/YER057c/UK114 family)